MENDVLIENNVVFIRNPLQNQGKPYTLSRPLTDEEKKRIDELLAGRGKQCVFGFDPINLNTGNYYYNTVDFTIPDFGGEFKISRTYNSKTYRYNGLFGNRWDTEWNSFLAFQADGAMAFDRGDGSRVYFDKTSNGTFKAPEGEIYTLEKNSSGFVLRQKDQKKYTFSHTGLLREIEDLNGNRTQLIYDEYEFLRL
jgi:hypothetical protein